MPVRKLKPVTPGSRGRIVSSFDYLHKGRPYKSLTVKKKNSAGRNNQGRITVFHRSGRRVLYRQIDFKYEKYNKGIPFVVERIEYDPNRTAHIALIKYQDGKKSYVIAQNNMRLGDTIVSSDIEQIKDGACLTLKDMPLGTTISCVELYPGKGAQVARSAGSFCRLMAKDNGYAILKMRSGQQRRFRLDCKAVVGAVSNAEHSLCAYGKAGAKRWKGIRPTVRGVAMNPVDHPHGGGEGKTSGGRHPVTPWGKPTKGYKTRKRNKSYNAHLLIGR